MNLLESMRIFATVVETGNLSEAGRRLHVSTSTVSKGLASLEERFGVTLISRTTRRLAVTDIGQTFYRRCSQILEDVDSVESELSELATTPRGRLRVTGPTVLSLRHISPHLAAFAKLYPDIHLEVLLTNENLDLVNEGIDVAIRVTSAPDPGLTAFPVVATRRVFCASPEFLAGIAPLRTPLDLAGHNCLILTGHTQNHWPYREGGRTLQVTVGGSFIANNPEVVRHAALAGLGIALLPTWLVGDDLRAGSLVAVLEDFEAVVNSLYLLTPPRRFVPHKTRLFIEFIRERLGPVPPWEREPT